MCLPSQFLKGTMRIEWINKNESVFDDIVLQRCVMLDKCSTIEISPKTLLFVFCFWDRVLLTLPRLSSNSWPPVSASPTSWDYWHVQPFLVVLSLVFRSIRKSKMWKEVCKLNLFFSVRVLENWPYKIRSILLYAIDMRKEFRKYS
jgi:hypothetical protein